MSKTIILFICILGFQFPVFATFPKQIQSYHFLQEEKKHSPHKASLYSALLPGLGQAYNKKYWKIPVIYTGLGLSTYFMLTNRNEMRARQKELIVRLDNDTNTRATNFIGTSVDVLISERNFHRTNRDYGIIAIAAFYVINIVDAAVDAHFYKFNIDKPLSQQRKKNWNIVGKRVQNYNTIGLSFTF